MWHFINLDNKIFCLMSLLFLNYGPCFFRAVPTHIQRTGNSVQGSERCYLVCPMPGESWVGRNRRVPYYKTSHSISLREAGHWTDLKWKAYALVWSYFIGSERLYSIPGQFHFCGAYNWSVGKYLPKYACYISRDGQMCSHKRKHFKFHKSEKILFFFFLSGL
jgi:hypothetical protein